MLLLKHFVTLAGWVEVNWMSTLHTIYAKPNLIWIRSCGDFYLTLNSLGWVVILIEKITLDVQFIVDNNYFYFFLFMILNVRNKEVVSIKKKFKFIQ